MLKLQVLEFVTRPADPEHLPPDLERALCEGIERTENKCREWLQRRWHKWEWNGFTVFASLECTFNINIVTPDGFHVYGTAKIRIFEPAFSSDDAETVLQKHNWTFRSLSFGPQHVQCYAPIWANYGKYVAFWQAWSVPVCDDVRRVIWSFLSD